MSPFITSLLQGINGGNAVRIAKKALIVGPFPPPLHGLSWITNNIERKLRESLEDAQVVRFNTALSRVYKDFRRLFRAFQYLAVWYRLMGHKGNIVLYLPLSGGLGQVYDLVTVLLGRARKWPIILHHHSTAYLYQKRQLSAILFAAAGPETYHIVLCEEMKDMLKECYGVKHVLTMSNLAFFPSSSPKTRSSLKTVGYLSNITLEKGGWDVLRLAHLAKQEGLPLHFLLAGPCWDIDLEAALLEAVAEGVVEWRGPVYGDEKVEFWQNIDVFVFPTRNEAEPLVVWEALAAGVPIISTGRGCIPEQVGNLGGMILPENTFVPQGLALLKKWVYEPEHYQKAAAAAAEQYQRMRKQAEQEWHHFRSLIETLMGE